MLFYGNSTQGDLSCAGYKYPHIDAKSLTIDSGRGNNFLRLQAPWLDGTKQIHIPNPKIASFSLPRILFVEIIFYLKARRNIEIDISTYLKIKIAHKPLQTA